MAGQEVVEGTSGRDGSGREALQQGRKWSWAVRQSRKLSGGPLAGPEEVGGTSGTAGSGQGGPLRGRKQVGGPLAGLEVFGGPPAEP